MSSPESSSTPATESTLQVDGLHRWLRAVCFTLIASMLIFALFNEMKPRSPLHDISHPPDTRIGIGPPITSGGPSPSDPKHTTTTGAPGVGIVAPLPSSSRSSPAAALPPLKVNEPGEVRLTPAPHVHVLVPKATTEEQNPTVITEQKVQNKKASAGPGDTPPAAAPAASTTGTGSRSSSREQRPRPSMSSGKQFPLTDADSITVPADIVDSAIYTPGKYHCISSAVALKHHHGEDSVGGGGGEKKGEAGDTKMATTAEGSGGEGTTAFYKYQFVFIPVGCWGSFATNGECSGKGGPRKEKNIPCVLGDKLARVAQCGHVKFGSFLGDNFYPFGLTSRKDTRIEREPFEKFWHHPQLRFPFYVALGNHDGKPRYQLREETNSSSSTSGGSNPGSVEPVVSAAGLLAKYWKAPAFHHVSPIMTGPDGKTTVQFFVFDTKWGYAKNDHWMPSEAAWLDAELTKAKEKNVQWKIIATHEPIWGFLGFPHGKGLSEHIHPILVKHHIRLLVVAHAHGINIHQAPGGYYQLTAAGFAENVHEMVKPNRPAGRFHLGTGATAVLIDSDRLDIVAFDKQFNLIFDVSIPFHDHPTQPTATTTHSQHSSHSPAAGEDHQKHPEDCMYGNTSWFPAHSGSYSSSNSGPKDYWQVLPQCEAMKPKLC